MRHPPAIGTLVLVKYDPVPHTVMHSMKGNRYVHLDNDRTYNCADLKPVPA